MINLFLTILFTSWLLISFRLFSAYKVNQLQAIIINYMVCMVLGVVFADNLRLIQTLDSVEPWMYLAWLTGAFFLPTFFLMSYTVEKVSLTISSIASKTSLIIPVSVSILFLSKDEPFTVLNFIGLGIGLIAILLSSVKKTSTASNNENPTTFVYFLPFLVFLGGGMVDVLINITNTLFLPKAYSGLFPLFAFSVAAIAGFIVLCYRLICKNEKITLKNCFAGVILGIPNYLSIFFLLKALQDFNNNGAVIFPILNIAVILVTTSVALLVLKEKLTLYNYIGLGLAVLSLGLILAS